MCKAVELFTAVPKLHNCAQAVAAGAGNEAMAEAMKAPEDLETHEKYACDINGDGKVSYDDLNTLTSMFPLYFVGEA